MKLGQPQRGKDDFGAVWVGLKWAWPQRVAMPTLALSGSGELK